MDLDSLGEEALAQRMLNHYLEQTGDYEGLSVLRFYRVYRAMVRAKVDAIRAGQADLAAQQLQAAQQECATYLALAASYTRQSQPRLLLTHGLSGSGKSTLTEQLMLFPDVIRMRSDVERKRLLKSSGKGRQNLTDLYSVDTRAQCYQRLAVLAQQVLEAGYTVLVDATFLDFDCRQQFEQLAEKLNLPWHILNLTASPQTLRARVSARENDASDADLIVLEQQLAHYQPLRESERGRTLNIDSQHKLDPAAIMGSVTASERAAVQTR